MNKLFGNHGVSEGVKMNHNKLPGCLAMNKLVFEGKLWKCISSSQI